MKHWAGRSANRLRAVDFQFALIGAHIYLAFCFFKTTFLSLFQQPKKKKMARLKKQKGCILRAMGQIKVRPIFQSRLARPATRFRLAVAAPPIARRPARPATVSHSDSPFFIFLAYFLGQNTMSFYKGADEQESTLSGIFGAWVGL